MLHVKNTTKQKMAINSIFEYIYRDASNYKVDGLVIIDGAINERQISVIKACLDCGVFFIPEYVGIPSLREKLYVFGSPNEDDHQRHEYVEIRPAVETKSFDLEIWGTATDLIRVFKTACKR